MVELPDPKDRTDRPLLGRDDERLVERDVLGGGRQGHVEEVHTEIHSGPGPSLPQRTVPTISRRVSSPLLRGASIRDGGAVIGPTASPDRGSPRRDEPARQTPVGHPRLRADHATRTGPRDSRLVDRHPPRPRQPRRDDRPRLGRGVRRPQGLRLVRRGHRRPGRRSRLHPVAQRAAPPLGRGCGRCREARPLRKAAGARRGRGPRHGRLLSGPRRRPPRGVHVEPSAEDPRDPTTRGRRRDRRSSPDPVLVLVCD